jgi:Domain of unknown function (DUF5069)
MSLVVRSMPPLDLTKAPPRSPRAEIRGLCMLLRMIDIARAMLPGGDTGEYLIGREKTLSAVVLGVFGTSVPEFVKLIGRTTTDDDVAESLWPAGTIPPEALSVRLRRVRVSDVPAELHPDFQRFYGTEHPLDRLVFDVLDADDVRAFGRNT